MGSIDKACISGFLCRLCSEMHRTVIHIYGDQGQKQRLLEKINGYLPVTITPTDPLPKTICEPCLRRVEQHYELLIKFTQYTAAKHKTKRLQDLASKKPPAETTIQTFIEEERLRAANMVDFYEISHYMESNRQIRPNTSVETADSSAQSSSRTIIQSNSTTSTQNSITTTTTSTTTPITTIAAAESVSPMLVNSSRSSNISSELTDDDDDDDDKDDS